MVLLPCAVLGALALAGCGGSSGATSTPGASSTPATAAAQAPGGTGTAQSGSAVSGIQVAAGVVRGSASGVTATLHAGTHAPRVGEPWPIHFTVTARGAPAHASVSYEYLYAGAVVARRSHYVFVGRFSDVFKWPATAVGYPLTFRAVVVSGGVTIDLDYPIQVGS